MDNPKFKSRIFIIQIQKRKGLTLYHYNPLSWHRVIFSQHKQQTNFDKVPSCSGAYFQGECIRIPWFEHGREHNDILIHQHDVIMMFLFPFSIVYNLLPWQPKCFTPIRQKWLLFQYHAFFSSSSFYYSLVFSVIVREACSINGALFLSVHFQ